VRTARKARRERLLKAHRRALLSSMESEFNGGYFFMVYFC
jgi:hypothetical protein